MDPAFSGEFLYSIFIEHDPEPESLPECQHFLNDIHLPEVVQFNPGFTRAARYERAELNATNQPRWLSLYEIGESSGAERYISRAHGPREGRPTYTRGPDAWMSYQERWRMIWRRRDSRDAITQEAKTLFLVGFEAEIDGLGENGNVPFVEYSLHHELLFPATEHCPSALVIYDTSKEDDVLRMVRGLPVAFALPYRRVGP